MQKYKYCTNVQQEMSEFIDKMEWNYFATLTTSYEQTMKSARRCVERFHEKLNNSGSTTLFFAAEPYDVKDGYHVHALIKTDIDFQNIVECYQVTSGGHKVGIHQRINLQKFRQGEGAAMYCAKYITKRLSDWDILLPKSTLFS
jgi:hypothetical protein